MYDDTASVRGTIIKSMFDKDSFHILLMEDDKGKVFSAKGEFGDISSGETLILYGHWGKPYKGKDTFEASYFERVLPESTAGMEEYLGSGCVEGCGPSLASKIVKKFGKDTFRILDSEPDRLIEIRGIGEVKKERIKAGWKKQKSLQTIGQFLFKIGIPIRYTGRIRREFGDDAINLIRNDPYCLYKIRGITFEMADETAMRMGIEKDSFFRIRSGLLYAMDLNCEMANTYVDRRELIRNAVNILKVDGELIVSSLTSLAEQGMIVIEDDALYTKELYRAETNTAEVIRKLVQSEACPCRVMNPEELEAVTKIRFSPMQLEAVKYAATESILVITGGPGTGKSTSLAGIIEQFERSGLHVVMAAPTGRAAKKMSEATGKEAFTIHRLLMTTEAEAEKNGGGPDGTAIDADVVVIDEMSMVDIRLMSWLLSYVKAGMHLVLLGDVDQLPSIGPGTVLKDIIRSGIVKTVKLDRIFRQEEGSAIIEDAERIRNGITTLRFNRKDEGVYLFRMNSDQHKVAEKVVDIAFRQIPEIFGFKEEDIQVLSPMRKYDAGVNNLNILLQEKFNRDGEKIPTVERLRTGDRVMNIRNNYAKGIFNGDIGRIKKIDNEDRRVRIAFDEAEFDFDYDELDDIVLCYATTIHKAQGAEYPVVVMPVVYGHIRMLQRTLLYTAVTRAKDLLVFVGEEAMITRAINTIQTEKRKGRLYERLIA